METVEILTAIPDWFMAINANAAISIYAFLKAKLTCIVIIICMYYVYLKRYEQARGSVIRFTKRVSSQKRDIKNRKLTELEQEEFNIKNNSLLIKYSMILGLTIIATMLTSTATLYAALSIWVAGSIAIYFLRGDFEEMAYSLEYHALLYPVAIITVSFFIMISDAPAADWGRTVGRAIHGGIPPVVSGYLSMLLAIVMFGFPISFANSIRQKWGLMFGNDDVKILMRNRLRTTNQSEFSREDTDPENPIKKQIKKTRRKI